MILSFGIQNNLKGESCIKISAVFSTALKKRLIVKRLIINVIIYLSET